jgi:hypothetical protein
VDLLHVFLDDTRRVNPTADKPFGTLKYPTPAGATTRMNELLKRRPDLVKITLSCENTNTPLPYIDLVNEALESFTTLHLDSNEEWTDSTAAGAAIEAHDTGNTPADELRAVPQYVKPAVYRHLATKAVYPMTLPFDRPLEVVRGYLGHLGTSRAEIMEVFRATSTFGSSEVAPTVHDVAIEVLGLSTTQAKIIEGSSSAGWDLSEYYGYASGSGLLNLNSVPEFLQRTGLDLNDLLELLKTRFVNPHRLVSFGRIAITFANWPDDACDVSKMTFVNLEPSGGAEPPESHRNLDRIHRFVRLWRVLGWTMADLDRALTALGGELNPEMLEKLAALKQAALDLDRPIADLLPLWGEISRWRDSSPYSAMVSPAIITDPAEREVFTSFKESNGAAATLDKHLPAVAAVLAITADDIQRIRSYLDPTGQALSTLDLKGLSALFRHGTLAKALGIRVRDLITLLSLAPNGANPFANADPRPAVKFVRLARTVLDSGFSIPLINYLFRGEAEPTHHPEPTRALIENTLGGLQKGLAAIFQETVVPEQPTAEDLRAALDLAKNFLGEKDATSGKLVPLSPDEALAILDPRVTQFNNQAITLNDRTTFAGKHFTAFLIDQSALFDSSFETNTSEVRFLQNVAIVLSALLPWLCRKEQELLIIQTLAGAVGVDEKVASALLKDKVDNKYLLHSIDADQRSALEDFLSLIDQAGAAVTFDVDNVSTAPVGTFIRLFKAAAYVTAFGMTEPELRLFASSSTPVTIPNLDPARLDFNLFPLLLAGGADPQPGQHFELWQQLAKYYQLRTALPKSEKTLPDFFPPPDKPTAAPDPKTLVEVTGWEQSLVEALRTGFKIEIKHLTELDWLSGFHRAVQLTKRLGAGLKQKKDDPTQLQQPNPFDWAANPPDGTQADAVAQMVKARYERAQWLDVARSLNDPMRERQRTALVDLLVARMTRPHLLLGKNVKVSPFTKATALKRAVLELQRKLNLALANLQSNSLSVNGAFDQQTEFAVKTFQQIHGLEMTGVVDPATWAALDRAVGDMLDRNELLEYFLIDIEMSSCMLTSRIKQAISSVQLFIHRCLLNLEPAVSPDEIDVEQWDWMKNYRVWEANRKVFLYPENWIEPELRDDKTPFFKELETELLQSELADKTVEKALINYLYKLDEVARLDIRGFCRAVVPENPKANEMQQEVYHVFGRTWNPPYVYYYRRGTYDVEKDSGAEWTPWERLDLDIQGEHLIPAIHDGRLYLFWPIFEEKSDEGQSGTNHWEIKMAWSMREQERWATKSTSRASVHVRSSDGDVEETGLGGTLVGRQHNFLFQIVNADANLAIRVYRHEPEYDTNLGTNWITRHYGTFALGSCRPALSAEDERTSFAAHDVGLLDYALSTAPLSSQIEFQDFTIAHKAQLIFLLPPTGFSESVLEKNDHGFYFLAQWRIWPEFQRLGEFFVEDGPDGSRTYFARPVKEDLTSMDPTLVAKFGDLSFFAAYAVKSKPNDMASLTGSAGNAT